MVLNQKRSRRKPTGGRYKQQRVRRQYETGREPALTKIDAPRTRVVRGLGGNRKIKALSENTMTLLKNGKATQAKITTVEGNAANRHFIRRNILTKGAVVQTDKGKARITNRPGQTGTVQGILIT